MDTTQRTADSLHAQWTQNTGTHFLDSGGTNDRNWQRNQGKTVADFNDAPDVVIEDGYVRVNAFTYLQNHLTSTADSVGLTSKFRAWVAGQPEGEAYYNTIGSVEEWLDVTKAQSFHDWTGHDSKPEGWNTYNWENSLDATLMGVDFVIANVHYVALSYHGGMDVRGGYTDFVVYESCDCLLYSTEDVTLWCTNSECDVYVEVGDGGETYGTEHEVKIGEPCPECGSGFDGTLGDCNGV